MDFTTEPQSTMRDSGFIALAVDFGRLISSVLVGNTARQMALWESIRPGGRRFLAILGVLVGACFSLTFVLPELLVDLLSPPMGTVWHYLSPVLGLGLLGGLVGIFLFGSFEISRRWEISGHKPAWVLHQEENQRAFEKWLLRFGPIKYVLLSGFLGGLAFIPMDLFILSRTQDPVADIPRVFTAFLVGFVIVSFGTGFATWRIFNIHRHQDQETGADDHQGP
jgi:hypothetical protein